MGKKKAKKERKRQRKALLWDSARRLERGVEVGERVHERGRERACRRVLCPAACRECLERGVADKERGPDALGKTRAPGCVVVCEEVGESTNKTRGDGGCKLLQSRVVVAGSTPLTRA